MIDTAIEQPIVVCETWLEAAIAVLAMSGDSPMKVKQIVARAGELGVTPPSLTKTPEQSLRRDLLAAVRRGDPRVALGEQPGDFVSGAAVTARALGPCESWLDAAVAVLAHDGDSPMKVKAIVERAFELGLAPASRTKTPEQSVRRDLLAAVRRGDTRVALGAAAGEFVRGATGSASGGRTISALGGLPRQRTHLRVGALVRAITARGGWSANTLRVGLGTTSREDEREGTRLSRAYVRACERGTIGLYDADAIAIRLLGVHPAAVWGEEWWDAESMEPMSA